jgi:glycylpeptide N-tetradecanoyltransferase
MSSETTSEQMKTLMDMINNMKRDYPLTKEDAMTWTYKYWNTQPMVQLNEEPTTSTKIVNLVQSSVETNSPEPYKFVTYNVETDIKKIVAFLQNNYAPKKDPKFRLKYSEDYVRWTLEYPDTVCIGLEADGKMGGFVSARTQKMQVYGNQMDMAEINFLCVHSKLRKKRVAETLIKEIRRIMNNKGLEQGIFFTDRYLPSPTVSLKYFHRPINYAKLLKHEYVFKEESETLEHMVKYYKVVPNSDKELVLMKEQHYQQAFECYNQYVDKYFLHDILTLQQFICKYKPSKVVKTYVLVKDDVVVDFVSFTILETVITGSTETIRGSTETIRGSTLSMYTCNETTSYHLLKNAIMFSQNHSCDIFNVTDALENDGLMKELKFIDGTGISNLYLFNWRCPKLNPSYICKTSV